INLSRFCPLLQRVRNKYEHFAVSLYHSTITKNMYKIAVVQLNLNNTPENNLQKCLSWVRDAANQGADVICLPELYSSHYFCQSEDTDMFALAEPLYGVSFNAFSALAKEMGVVIIVPFF